MITEAYIIDKNTLEIKDNIKSFSGNLSIPLYAIGSFAISYNKEDISLYDYISIFVDGRPLTSLIVTKINPIDKKIEGKTINYLFSSLLSFHVLAQDSLVETINVEENVIDLFTQILDSTMSKAIVYDIDSDIDAIYKAEIRLKNVNDLLKEMCIQSDTHFSIFLFGNGKVNVYFKKNKNKCNYIKLLSSITHETIERIETKEDQYNQIIGLGAGNASSRDYHFIDDSNGDFKRCYILDISDEISHEELTRRTVEKFASLKNKNYSKFKILKNNLYKFGIDYFLGDYVQFSNDVGLLFDDLITSCNLTVENGMTSLEYEVIIGNYVGTLTDKINELKKEGGIK